MPIGAVLVNLFGAPAGAGAVEFGFESAVGYSESEDARPWSAFNVTITSDSDLVIVAAGSEVFDVDGITLGGTAMTLFGTAEAQSTRPTRFYYLSKAGAGGGWPSPGSRPVVVTPANAQQGMAAAVVLKGAAQTAPGFAADSATSSRTAMSIATSVSADGFLFCAGVANGGNANPLSISLPTIINAGAIPSVTASFEARYDQAPSANETVTGTCWANTYCAIGAAWVSPAS